MIDEKTAEINEKIAISAKVTGKKYLAIHYTGINGDVTAKSISWYHIVTLGWWAAGYHYLLNSDGRMEMIEPVEKAVNGMLWHWSRQNYLINKNALQVVFETIEGNVFNKLQEEVLIDLCQRLIKHIPGILIGGHREFPFQTTFCPGYDVEAWLLENNFPQENNYYLKMVRNKSV